MLPVIGIVVLFAIAQAQERLVFVSAIFRHGLRAPERTLNGLQYDKEAFPYGLGELTEAGIRRSHDLGRFLANRYVDNVFLSQNVDNREFYIQSVDNNRCLMSAQALAQGMFSPSSRVVPMPIPVHTRPLHSDWMLAFPWDKCDALGREFARYCNFPDIRSLNSLKLYQSTLFECMGAKGSFFNDTQTFAMADSLIAHELAGSPLPAWYTPYLRMEARAIVAKALRFQLGLGEYFNPTIIRLTTGQLFDTILKEILHKWNCQMHRDDPNCFAIQPLKFKAVSADDSVLISLLETIGARREALAKALTPQNSAVLIFELWNVQGQAMIKVLYKRGPHSSKLVNLSGNTRNCKGVIACPLERFAACCDEFRTSSPMEECLVKPVFPTPGPLPALGLPPLPTEAPVAEAQSLPPPPSAFNAAPNAFNTPVLDPERNPGFPPIGNGIDVRRWLNVRSLRQDQGRSRV